MFLGLRCPHSSPGRLALSAVLKKEEGSDVLSQPHAQGLKRTKHVYVEKQYLQRDGEGGAPLRAPVQTLGGCVLCLGPLEITTALAFIECSPYQGLSRYQGLMPSSSAQKSVHTCLEPMPTMAFLGLEFCLASKSTPVPEDQPELLEVTRNQSFKHTPRLHLTWCLTVL